MLSRTARLLIGVSALAFAARDASAQPLRGVVRDSLTGQPVAGAVVSRVRGDSVEGRALTDSVGQFRLLLGTSRQLSVRRLGYRELRIAAPADSLALVLSPLPTLLARLQVLPEGSCSKAPAGDLVEQLQASLLAVLVHEESPDAKLRLVRYERTLTPRDGRELPGSLQIRQVVASRSFSAVRSVAAFRDSGFVRDSARDRAYLAPDLAFLSSPEFARGYCFTLVKAPRDSRELTVTFAPREVRRGITDLTGRLVVDTVTRELRDVTFQYTNISPLERLVLPGGFIRFAATSNGTPLLTAWRLWLPSVPALATAGSTRVTLSLGSIYRRELGGWLLEGRWNDGMEFVGSRDDMTELLGSVALAEPGPSPEAVRADSIRAAAMREAVARADSMRRAREDSALLAVRGQVAASDGILLSGAEVEVMGTTLKARTDAMGRFVIPVSRDSSYTVVVRRIGFAPRTQRIPTRGAGASPVIRLVQYATALAPVVTAAPRKGLFGVVADSTHQPISDARISVMGSALRTRSDSSGAFSLPLAAGAWVLRVERPPYGEELVGVTVPADSGREVAIWLTRTDRATAAVVASQRFDLNQRIMRQKGPSAHYFSRDGLLEKGILELSQLARQWANGSITADCLVTVYDPTRYSVPLNALSTSDVEFVELYQASTVGGAQPRGRTSLGGNRTTYLTPTSSRPSADPACGNLALIAWLRK